MHMVCTRRDSTSPLALVKLYTVITNRCCIIPPHRLVGGRYQHRLWWHANILRHSEDANPLHVSNEDLWQKSHIHPDSLCPSVSVANIIDCATSPALNYLPLVSCLSLWNCNDHLTSYVKIRHHWAGHFKNIMWKRRWKKLDAKIIYKKTPICSIKSFAGLPNLVRLSL